MRVARKFFAALVLVDIINEIPLDVVAAKYEQYSASIMRELQDSAGKTAGMVAAFCAQMGWHDLELLVTKFRGTDTVRMTGRFVGTHSAVMLALSTAVHAEGNIDTWLVPYRVAYDLSCVMCAGCVRVGVQSDLIALTEIPGIGVYRARALYKAGLRTPESLAAADVNRITDILVAGEGRIGKHMPRPILAAAI